jgi:ATP-binding cassette subfamily C (CFTR/MRP) protein 4
MGYLIAYFMTNPYEHTEEQAYLFAIGIAVLQIVLVLAFHPVQLYFFQSALKLRVASCSLIYKKVWNDGLRIV